MRLSRRKFVGILGIAAAGAVAAYVGAEEILNAQKSSPVTTASSLTSNTISSSVDTTINTTINTNTPDYQTFVAPYKSNFDSLCSWLMQPYAPGQNQGKPGYYVDSQYGGLIKGDNACYSCSGGLFPAVTLNEINITIGRYLDFWNAQRGNPTSIEANSRAILHPGASFVQGYCPAQGSASFTYNYLDKHELFFGTSPGQVVYGDQFNSGYAFLRGRVPDQSNPCGNSQPYIDAIIVSNSFVIDQNSSTAQNLIFYALNQYILGNVSTAKSIYDELVSDWTGTDFNKYQVAHNSVNHQAVGWGAFVHGSRAMKFIWQDSNALNVAKQAAAQCWTLQSSGGGIINGASLGVSSTNAAYLTGPEPATYVGIAFDPRVPSWFP